MSDPPQLRARQFTIGRLMVTLIVVAIELILVRALLRKAGPWIGALIGICLHVELFLILMGFRAISSIERVSSRRAVFWIFVLFIAGPILVLPTLLILLEILGP